MNQLETITYVNKLLKEGKVKLYFTNHIFNVAQIKGIMHSNHKEWIVVDSKGGSPNYMILYSPSFIFVMDIHGNTYPLFSIEEDRYESNLLMDDSLVRVNIYNLVIGNLLIPDANHIEVIYDITRLENTLTIRTIRDIRERLTYEINLEKDSKFNSIFALVNR